MQLKEWPAPSENSLTQAVREMITHEIDIIHESDWWKEMIDEAVDRRLAEREMWERIQGDK